MFDIFALLMTINTIVVNVNVNHLITTHRGFVFHSHMRPLTRLPVKSDS